MYRRVDRGFQSPTDGGSYNQLRISVGSDSRSDLWSPPAASTDFPLNWECCQTRGGESATESITVFLTQPFPYKEKGFPFPPCIWHTSLTACLLSVCEHTRISVCARERLNFCTQVVFFFCVHIRHTREDTV